jgi:CDP-glycerol glycerophosphotransferase (TagB/SpsB family)
MGFEYYDRVAFINRDRMQRYLDAGIVTPAQAVLLGYPKLDRLANGGWNGARIRAEAGLVDDRPAVLYAPTYSTASSLHIAGEAIVSTLAASGLNVIVKLHDRSLDSDPRYNGGIDWRARMRALEQPGRVRFVEGADASPWLAAADAMVTDHSSVGFEYFVLDRPLVVFDAPDLAREARINPEKIALLRSAASVVTTVDDLVQTLHAELAHPGRLSGARKRVASDVFYRPGTATDRAVALARELLGRQRPRVIADPDEAIA